MTALIPPSDVPQWCPPFAVVAADRMNGVGRRSPASGLARGISGAALSPPAIVVGRYGPARHLPDTFEAGAEVLTGLAVSPGVVTGPALA
jgi:hypothetical protein